MISIKLFIRHLMKRGLDSLSHNLLCTGLQNNNIIKYGAVLITGFPCLAVMPEKFTPLPRPIIRSHMSGAMTLYNERLSIASLIKGLATRCRFRLTPV